MRVDPDVIGQRPCDHGAVTATTPEVDRPYWQLPRPAEDNRVVAGVAAGIATEIGVDPLVIRMAFVLLATAGGWGVLLYGAAWGLMGWRGAPDGRQVAMPKGANDATRLLGVALVVFGLLLVSRWLGLFVDSFVWPLALFAAGVAVAHQRGVNWRGTAGRIAGDQDRSAFLVRVAGGGALVLAGIALAITLNFEFRSIRDSLLVVAVVIAGLVVVLGPWIVGLIDDLTDERRARIRSDERAAVAAHLHDSVLQTLALIQRRADDPHVVGLARKQERELRSWLFGEGARVEGASFRAQLQGELAAVEELHTVPIEVIVVGDATMDDDLASVIAATREAATNAAVHSKAAGIDVFAEVGEKAVDVFVRDTGVGFDLDAVPEDRRGVADSIIGRIERLGGSAVVVTSPGEGTEVELHIERGRT